MVRIRNSKPLVHKLSVLEGWYLFAEVFFPEFEFECGVCSFSVDANTNPGYLNVENMLPTPSVVEITHSNSHTRIAKGNATDDSV